MTTHTATQTGRLRSYEVSPPFVPDLNSYALTQIISSARVQVQFVEYFSARDAWRAANTRDKHQDFSAAEAVPELQPELLVEYVPGLRPWWMAPWAFALASFTLSALCYKVAFNARCGRQEVLFVKDAVGFADDAVCEEAHMYDAEKAAEAKGGVVIVPVVVQAVAPSNGYAGEVERG